MFWIKEISSPTLASQAERGKVSAKSRASSRFSPMTASPEASMSNSAYFGGIRGVGLGQRTQQLQPSKYLVRCPSSESLSQLRIKPDCLGDVVDGVDFFQLIGIGREQLSEFVFCTRQGDDRYHLREVGVGRSAGQKPQVIVTVLFCVAPKPGAGTETFTEPTWSKGLLQREGVDAAIADDKSVSGIGTCTTLLKPHRLLAGLCPMHDPSPIDILDMTPLTGPYEANWRDFGPLTIVAIEISPPLSGI